MFHAAFFDLSVHLHEPLGQALFIYIKNDIQGTRLGKGTKVEIFRQNSALTNNGISIPIKIPNPIIQPPNLSWDMVRSPHLNASLSRKSIPFSSPNSQQSLLSTRNILLLARWSCGLRLVGVSRSWWGIGRARRGGACVRVYISLH